MEKQVNQDKISELLSRGVEEIIDRDNLLRKLKTGKKLRVKLGIDPTSPNLHLGRSIPLLKLKDFQDLGHQIVFIIGDFTGIIGDTSDKDSERPMLSEEKIKENLKTYIDQASRIIDVKKAEIHYNSEWLGKLKYKDIGLQANGFSLNEFISRDNISRRLKAGKRVSLRELLYPLMQGYDSVMIKSDVEIGGTDQRFNLLAGRDLQRLYGQEAQDIITNPLIEGLDGRKMSSSYGNTVNLIDTPNEMFGKIMSLKDDFIIKYFSLLTRVDMKIIKEYEANLKAGANPRDIKLELASALVTQYHSAKDAQLAQEYFINTFSKKLTPTDMVTVAIGSSSETLFNILKKCLADKSRSDIKRLVEQGAVRIENKVCSDLEEVIKLNESGLNLNIGKRLWLKIKQ